MKMKKLIKLFSALFLVSAFFISCDKENDDNGVAQKNYLKVGEKEYVLSQGLIVNHGQAISDEYWQHEGYNYVLSLVSSDIAISIDSYGEIEALGSGQIILFELFSSKNNELDSRLYHFSSTQPYPVGTFDYAGFSLNWTGENDESYWFEITSGKVTVDKSEKDYSITIDCKSKNGESVTGFFKGSLPFFDYSVETKSTNLNFTKKTKKKKQKG